ncbi:hypothetical protein NKG05_10320 [Oerskovia sp. M15]
MAAWNFSPRRSRGPGPHRFDQRRDAARPGLAPHDPGRVRVARMLVYLGTIVAFYFAVGLVIMLGAGRSSIASATCSTPAR